VTQLADGLTYFVVFLLSTTLHEAAHAWVALRGGDPTAYRGGQVSLDPIPHIRREPFGMLILPLLTAFAVGWPIGYASAPYNPDWARRHPERAAVMALAGPAANFLLVIVAAIALRVGEANGVFYAPDRITFGHIVASDAGGVWQGAALMLGAFFSVNLLLGAFNLLPLPPLDGSGAMPLLLSRRATQRYQDILWGNPAISLIGLFVAWKLFDVVFDPLFTGAVNLLYPGRNYQ
jgi:Zn-dependent protease